MPPPNLFNRGGPFKSSSRLFSTYTYSIRKVSTSYDKMSTDKMWTDKMLTDKMLKDKKWRGKMSRVKMLKDKVSKKCRIHLIPS
jgi:hypothetical protein